MGKILTDREIVAWLTGEATDVTSTDVAVSHQLLRGMLRRVMEAPCDTTDGEYGPRPVCEAMAEDKSKMFTPPAVTNAALLAEVEAAVEGKQCSLHWL
jgi:hypothetical protein